MFYNVENLFDCKNDSLTNDDEFTPQGIKHWTNKKFYSKLNAISKTILAINEWHSPELIGLCEVENQFVLNQLIYSTGLNHLNYKLIHHNSSDRRGIDVALLYKANHFEILEEHSIPCSNPDINFYTRDALYAKGIMHQRDTLHLIINHWPSKRGGELASEAKRIHVANSVKTVTDSIFQSNPKSHIILMGDFNAELKSESLELFMANNNFVSVIDPQSIVSHKVAGSHKYQGHWSLIDHILISNNLNLNTNMFFTHQIGQLPHLLKDDQSYSGCKPHRTYAGPRYVGGVSDHLPVLLKVTYSKNLNED